MRNAEESDDRERVETPRSVTGTVGAGAWGPRPGLVTGPFPVLLLAVWFGSATGLLELSLLVARVEVFEKGVFLRSPHFVWMVPVSDLALFGVCGLALVVVARSWRRGAAWLVVGAFVFLGCLGPLLLIRGLHALAAVFMAGGVACHLAPILVARWPRVLRLIRRTVPALLGVVVVLVILAFGREAVARRQALAGRPSPPTSAMNVVLVVLDTVRADRLSLHGYGRDTTPNLARLATGGVRFGRAHSAAPWTLPSHASMFTGRWPHELDADRLGKLDDTYPTLAEFLSGRGYATVGVVANQFFCGRESGLARGFDDYRDYPVTPGAVLRSSTLGWFLERNAGRARRELAARLGSPAGAVVPPDFHRKDAAQVNGEFLDWLSTRGEDRPFFAFLNYFDAHDPYLLPPGSCRHFGKVPGTRAEFTLLKDWQKVTRGAVRPADLELASDAYDDCIASLDRELGRLFAALGRRGLLERTVVIVTADHGEEFGEHGLFRHGVSLYESEIHVPLVILAPGLAPAGRDVREPVSLRDLPSTVTELLGQSQGSPFPGTSLSRTWGVAAAPAGRPADVPLSEMTRPVEPTREQADLPDFRGPSEALVADDQVYIRHERGREELYDLDSDPAESRDLSRAAASEPLLTRFRQTLERILRDAPPPPSGPAPSAPRGSRNAVEP